MPEGLRIDGIETWQYVSLRSQATCQAHAQVKMHLGYCYQSKLPCLYTLGEDAEGEDKMADKMILVWNHKWTQEKNRFRPVPKPLHEAPS